MFHNFILERRNKTTTNKSANRHPINECIGECDESSAIECAICNNIQSTTTTSSAQLCCQSAAHHDESFLSTNDDNVERLRRTKCKYTKYAVHATSAANTSSFWAYATTESAVPSTIHSSTAIATSIKQSNDLPTAAIRISTNSQQSTHSSISPTTISCFTANSISKLRPTADVFTEFSLKCSHHSANAQQLFSAVSAKSSECANKSSDEQRYADSTAFRLDTHNLSENIALERQRQTTRRFSIGKGFSSIRSATFGRISAIAKLAKLKQVELFSEFGRK